MHIVTLVSNVFNNKVASVIRIIKELFKQPRRRRQGPREKTISKTMALHMLSTF